MRIILVQAEIELALRAYVLNQISVREGQEITIAFKNTRGDDGATAEIDISTPSNIPTKVPSTPLKRQAAPTPLTDLQTASQTALQMALQASSEPEVVEDASDPSDGSPAPAVEAESDTTASEEATPVQDASTTSEADDAAETGNQKEEEPVSKPASFLKPTAQPSDEAPAPSKSLFANLTKPVNPKPE